MSVVSTCWVWKCVWRRGEISIRLIDYRGIIGTHGRESLIALFFFFQNKAAWITFLNNNSHCYFILCSLRPLSNDNKIFITLLCKKKNCCACTFLRTLHMTSQNLAINTYIRFMIAKKNKNINRISYDSMDTYTNASFFSKLITDFA